MTFSHDEHWEGTCDKCNRDKPVRYFHGNGQDTWDFYLCDRCLENFFNNYLGISLKLSGETCSNSCVCSEESK